MAKKLVRNSTTAAKQTVPKSPVAKAKIHKVMKEAKAGTLKSSSGAKVKKRSQAVAIALSEARRVTKKSAKK